MSSNDQKYIQILKQIDPQLYMIRLALAETQINPDILPRIIRVLGNLNIGTGYGELTILIKDRVVTQIKGNESDVLQMSLDKKLDN